MCFSINHGSNSRIKSYRNLEIPSSKDVKRSQSELTRLNSKFARNQNFEINYQLSTSSDNDAIINKQFTNTPANGINNAATIPAEFFGNKSTERNEKV